MNNQAGMGYVGQSNIDNQPTYPNNISYQAPVAYGQPMEQFNTRSMEIFVPNGAFGGTVLQVTDPNTRQVFQVTVPSGLQPGMKFIVQLNSPNSPQYGVPLQQPMTYQPQPPVKQNKNDDCSAFLLGACFCCTLCCLTDGS